MVELRKRPARAEPAPLPPSKKKAPAAAAATKGKKGAAKNDAPKETKPPASNPADDPSGGLPEGAGGVSATADITTAEEAQAVAAKVEADAVKGKTDKKTATGPPSAGDTIDLDGFGGKVETDDGKSVTLAQLVHGSKAGVVLFTYPKASTPGCTTQVCLFRDSYSPLTATGLLIFGLSTDSPKANTTFKTKQNLPYPLLCDPAATLIQAIGFKKAPKGTTRGVFVVDKSGKVLAVEAGGPAATVEVVKAIVEKAGGDASDKGIEKAENRAVEAEGTEVEDKLMADTAAEVADTAEKVDGTPKL